jgi:exportin-2 (importin alpha re-exporter)
MLQVCEKIVIPNTRLREDAEELFDFNWLEYVRQDAEGSDADTRRRAASELVRALTDKFPAEVRLGLAPSLWARATSNATDWQASACAGSS